MKSYLKLIYLYLPLFFLCGCLSDPDIPLLNVTTGSVVYQPNGVMLQATIFHDNELYLPNISRYGFCYSTQPSPTINDFVLEGNEKWSYHDTSTSYMELLSGLDEKTTYYVRAFAQNMSGVIYGNEISFEYCTYENMAVDLGLSVQWALCNLGANEPEEYGWYFRWGDASPFEYASNFSANRDAASRYWGDQWRRPTSSEISELIYGCNWNWTSQNGVLGYKVVGPNGNSIFLPMVGYYNSHNTTDEGTRLYWTSSSEFADLYYGEDSYYNEAKALVMNMDGDPSCVALRWYIRGSIRPVLPKANIPDEDVVCYTLTFNANGGSGSMSSKLVTEGSSIVLPSNTFTRSEYTFSGWNTKADGSGISYNEGERISISEHLTLYAQWKSCYVDLGLPSGTLWKDSNEGGRNVYYTYEEAINKFANKLPTLAQLEELKYQCTWTWTGSGYNVVGPNGNRIYLPAAGGRNCDGGVGGVDSSGYYWSSTCYKVLGAYELYFDSDETGIYYGNFCYGQSVRLVQN